MLAISAALAAGPAAAVGRMGNLDIVTRSDGQVLPVYPGGGRNWVVGMPGWEYSIRYCNSTPGRVLAVMSVDGRDVDLSPGMTATVEIKTDQRRLIEYLLSPLLRYKQESLRER